MLNEILNCIESQIEPEPFSGVIYLTKGNEVLFERAYGFAIKSESTLNTVNTRFQIASGCKSFTALAICHLVEEQKLRFDTRLSECIDISFPNYAPDITIHHLLTHSSGIGSYYEEDVNPDYEAVWQDLPMYKMKESRDFVPLFHDKPMKFSPGKKFDYNDSGYIILGLVIEYITGLSFSAYIGQNVFKPAGMSDSGYFRTDQLPERTAYSYIKNSDGTWRTNFFAVPIVGGPDGGAYTTAPDMARFWKALTDNKLLTAETKKTMLKPQIATLRKSPYTHYGHGVWIDSPGETVRKFFAEGSDPGVAFRSAVYPDKDLVFTMVGNTSDAIWPLYKKIEEIMTSSMP